MSGQFIGKCFCMITGASSGFGQSIAQLLVKEDGLFINASHGSKIVFLSRNIPGMELTKKLMNENGKGMERFSVECLQVDLSDSLETESTVKEFLGKQEKEFDNFLLFNNSGVLGEISSAFLDCKQNMQDFQKFFNINMISPIFLIKESLNHFKNSKRTVVQTSSVAAIKPLSGLSTYCTSKAGMDMFMKCLAIDHPDVTTLSYSPGPMDTKMFQNLTDNHYLDSVRSVWKDDVLNPISIFKNIHKILSSFNGIQNVIFPN